MGNMLLQWWQEDNGTRLGHTGPKGTYCLFENKSLFKIFFEELERANKKYTTIIPLYIMTSKENNKETIEYLENNNW